MFCMIHTVPMTYDMYSTLLTSTIQSRAYLIDRLCFLITFIFSHFKSISYILVQYFDQRNLKSNLLLYSSHQIGERTVQENRHKPHLHIQEAETGEFLLHLLSGNGPSEVASRQVSADEVDAGSVWVGVVRRISTLLPSVSLWYGKPIGLPCRP